MKRSVLVVELVLLGIAAALALVPLPAPLIEKWYSVGIYPHIERALTPLSNRIPFAIFDLLLVTVAAGVTFCLARAVVRGWRARSAWPLVRTAFHVAATAASLYIVFLAMWGFNYRRVSMGERLILDRAAPSTEDVVNLGLMAVSELNGLYPDAHMDGAHPPEWQDASLRSAFAQVEQTLSDAPDVAPGRLKRTLLGPYFRWTGVDGMVNPYGLEVLVNPGLLPFERPFVAAHEWGHLAGYADESEANFVGWLTCIRASRAAQYSGWMFLYWQIAGELDAQSRAQVNRALMDGPRRDINAVVARLQRDELPVLQAASWRVYDQYLKANRVAAGVRSYGLVVNLILRARYAPGWIPMRRGTLPRTAAPNTSAPTSAPGR